MKILPRLDLRFKKRFSNQGLSNTPRIKKAKGLHSRLKRGRVVVPILRSLFMLNMVENMKAGVHLARVIAIVMVRVAT